MNAIHMSRKPARSTLGWAGFLAATMVSMGAAGTIALRLVDNSGSKLRSEQQKVMGGADPTTADHTARAVLKKDPLDARAVETIALIADRRRDQATALKTMKLASKLSRRQQVTQAWLFESLLQRGDFNGAFNAADALLRLSPGTKDRLFPPMTAALSYQGAAPAMVARLEPSPLWRPGYIATVAANADQNVTYNLLEKMAASKAPATPVEVGFYLRQLVERKQYDQALLGWFLFLKPSQLNLFEGLYDGDFKQIGEIEPFNWYLYGGEGAQVDVSPPPGTGADNALHILYDGVSNPRLASQLVVLPQGAHVFSMEARVDGSSGVSPLAWTLTCVSSGEMLFKIAYGTPDSALAVAQEFVVPPNCPAQSLELVPVPGEIRTSINAWYDKLKIAPRREKESGS